MSRVSIMFDRLRSEEKMLRDEAAGQGHAVDLVDAKGIRLDTDSTPGAVGLGDVVLERCISYFRGLHITSALEFMGVTAVNSFAVAGTCGNKMFMTLRLKEAGVPTPKTYFAFTSDSARGILEDGAGYPLVIKPVVGSWGRGIVPLRDADTADAVFETREISDGPHDRIFYLQEIVDRPPRDIRVITVGEQAVAAMYRSSGGGGGGGDGFTTNIALGAKPELCPLTPEIEELALKAAAAVGGGILGVDMMEVNGGEGGLVVHEVNNTVEFKGIATVSGTNIPAEMIRYAVSQVRK